MATLNFLLQGFTSSSHLDAINSLFELTDIEQAILSVAFLNRAGVHLLDDPLSAFGSKIDAFVGIRNDITSHQGLRALFNHGVRVHYVDTGSRHVIFHPKIYYTRSNRRARIVVGSANLTPGGLNNNIEASVTLDLDLRKATDLAFSESIVRGFSTLAKDHPQHVVHIRTLDDLDNLTLEGRLLDEASTRPPHSVTTSRVGRSDSLGVIELMLPRIKPRVERVRLSNIQATIRDDGDYSLYTHDRPSIGMGQELILVWKSKPLTERDLSIPSGKTTHATGSINLDKGLLEDEIDHRHYFREEVFAALLWKTAGSATVDETTAQFELVVKGIACGEFTLRIGHTTSTTSVAYLQRNAMTRLSWGEAKKVIAHRYLIGRTMSLYRYAANDTKFVIEID